MKRTSKRLLGSILAVLFLAFASPLLPAVDIEERPNGCILSWTETEGASFYDIYIDNQFVTRLSSDVFSYEVKNLSSETSYHLAFAARDEANNTLSSDFATFSTTTWNGTYRWENQTGKTNGGKLTELVFRAETIKDDVYGEYVELYMIEGDVEYRVFPLFDLDAPPVGWTDYGSSIPQAVAYRLNAEKFNTSPFTPSSWRVVTITLGTENPSVTVETKALGIAVDTTITYSFFIDGNGKRNLRFVMDGSGIVKKFLLFNPNEGSDGSYVLTEV